MKQSPVNRRLITEEERRKRLADLMLCGGAAGWREFVAPEINSNLTLASLGVPATGLCTVLIRLTYINIAVGTQQAVTISDGTTNNAQYLRQTASGAFVVGRTMAGVGGSSTSMGTPVSGVAMKAGLVLPGDGTARGSMNGGAVLSFTGGPTSGLTTLTAGASTGGTQAITGGGSIALLRILPGIALSDADLIAAVNAL